MTLEPVPVAFGAGGSGTVTIGPLSGNAPQFVKVESLTFNAGSTYTINDLNGNQELFLTTGSILVDSAAKATINAGLRIGAYQATGLDLEKTGAGTLELTGAKGTTVGYMTVAGGKLILNRDDSEVVNSSGMTIKNGSVVQLGSLHVRNINDSAPITITSGTFDLNGKSETIGSLKLESGSVTGPGTLIANGGYTVESGIVTANLGKPQFGPAPALEKKGTGVVTLEPVGQNSYGTTILTAGTLKLGSPGALPLNGAVRFNGGTLELNNQVIPTSGVLGILMLQADSVLKFDADGVAGSIKFSAASHTAGTLTLLGWSSTAAGRDHLYISSDPGSTFLNQVEFRDANNGLISTKGLWDGPTGEITPDMSVVPEPTNIALMIFGSGALAVCGYRNIRGKESGKIAGIRG